MEYPFKDLLPLDEVTARTGYYRDWSHIDADTFHQISELAKFIRKKGYGSDTREAIAQALERVYHDAAKSGNANMEVSMARKHFKDLATRLDASDDKLTSATAQLAQTVKRGENESVTKPMLAQDIKEELNNGSIEFKLNTSEIEDGAVTSSKLSSEFWKALALENTKKSLINNLGDNKYYTIDNLSSSEASTEYRSVIIQREGYYFPSYYTSKFETGRISVGMRVRSGTGFELRVDFREELASGEVLETVELSDYGDGWYFAENMIIPTGVNSATIRIDYRGQHGTDSTPLVVDYVTIEDGEKLYNEPYAPHTVVERTDKIEKEISKPKLENLVPYKFPNEFRWKNNPLSGKIFTDGKGNFEVIDFDIRQYIPSGKTYYVDKEKGSSENTGLTIDSPLGTLAQAYNKPDCAVIRVAEGKYNRAEGLHSAGQIKKDLAIIALEGHEVELHAGNPMVEWQLVSGHTGVYSSYRGGGLPYIVDTTETNEYGAYKKLTKVNTVEDVENTPASYAHIGTTVYTRLHDSRKPDNETVWVMTDANTIETIGEVTLYLEGITVYGGSNPVNVMNEATGLRPRVYGKDCDFFYSGSEYRDAVQLQGVYLSIFENCRAGLALKDGFNYHWRNGIAPLSIEINCQGFDNGNDSDDNDQGSTTHDGGSIIRINGAYFRNSGANIAEDATVGEFPTESLNLGCVGFESVSPSPTRAVNFDCYAGVNMWVDGCVGYGSEYNVKGDIKVRNSNFTGVLNPEGTEPAYY